jgi:hypothetical protein
LTFSGHRTYVILTVAAAALALICLAASSCCAIVPYSGYLYDVWHQPTPAPLPYVPVEVKDGSALGVGALKEPGDLFVDDAGRIYILDTGNNRLVCMDSDWNALRVISEFDNNGSVDRFSGPRGLFVTSEGDIYVADTGNARVVVLDSEGQFVRAIGQPVSDVEGVIPEGFRYRPIRLAVDSARRLFVVAEGQFEGIVEFDENGVFRGFFGAPRVAPRLIDVLWTKIASREQRGQLAAFVPTEYSSVDLDSKGFLYATIAVGEKARTEPIVRLSPGGQSVLRALGFIPPKGDKEVTWEEVMMGTPPSKFIDIVARESGIYSALDLNRGRVFTYDSDGHLLYVFGARGYQAGAAVKPSAIEEINGNLLVLDAITNTVTVYKPTEYAAAIHRALGFYYIGDYANSDRMWREVLRLNANNDRAYTGIGSTLMMNGQFAEAMRYFRLGQNRSQYSKAFRFYRNDVVREYFPTVASVFVIVVVVLFIAAKLGVFRALRRRADSAYRAFDSWCLHRGGWVSKVWLRTRDTGRGLCYALHIAFHPFDGFWDLKYEGRGNAYSATVILIVACSSYVFLRQYTGFIFNWSDLTKLNIYSEFASVLTPFFLWCIINWSLTTLMEGKGGVKDIYIASCYALTPLALINFPVTILGNFVTLEEGGFVYFFMTVGIVWMGALLFLGTMVTHHYSGVKTVYTSVLTCAGIIIAIFVGVFFFVLVDQMVMFVRDIAKELALRM